MLVIIVASNNKARLTLGKVLGAKNDQKIIPALRAYWYSRDFENFVINVKAPTQRAPDGLFHPSSAPLAPEDALFEYMIDPDGVEQEQLDVNSLLAITVGHFFHELIQQSLLDIGLAKSVEFKVEDSELRTRGFIDVILKDGQPLEIKTINQFQIDKMTNLEYFIEKKPQYYAQAIEYMRMLGAESERILWICTSYPFTMNEFVIPYNKEFSDQVVAKYRRVLERVRQYENLRH